MKYVTIYNPKDTEVEWRVGGILYFLKPKEKAIFEEFVAKMALVETNTGLVEYEPKNIDEVVASRMGYEKLPWKELIKLASKEGVFRPGMSRSVLEEALRENDRKDK